MSQRGFTLVELMVATVAGLIAISAAYGLGASMSRRFYEEQRVATSQGGARQAITELKRDISRAGLFGTPNADFEATCETTAPTLPLLGGGSGPMGAFQYYPDEDLATIDPTASNAGVRGDRLRVLTNLYTTDQLLVHSVRADGTFLVFQSDDQAFRRTFAWGQTAGPFFIGAGVKFLTGDTDWVASWAGNPAHVWYGLSEIGKRAFARGSVLHVETPEGRHFFRPVFGAARVTGGAGVLPGTISMQISTPLPVTTACIPGQAEGSTAAPLHWVEYAVVDPFDEDEVGAGFMEFQAMWSINLEEATSEFRYYEASDLLESPNPMLVRRILDASDQTVRPGTTQVLAEFVTSFKVSFLVDDESGSALPPDLNLVDDDASAINDAPEKVRAVLIELGVRSPLEDRTLPYNGGNTRFDIDPAQVGSSRVRMIRIEIPVPNVAARNLG